jgi:hypothetical protein
MEGEGGADIPLSTHMKIFTWNIRGLTSPCKKVMVRRLSPSSECSRNMFGRSQGCNIYVKEYPKFYLAWRQNYVFLHEGRKRSIVIHQPTAYILHWGSKLVLNLGDHTFWVVGIYASKNTSTQTTFQHWMSNDLLKANCLVFCTCQYSQGAIIKLCEMGQTQVIHQG